MLLRGTVLRRAYGTVSVQKFPGLFLHSPVNRLASVSYLDERAPNDSFSPSTIGFQDNPDFVSLLHEVLDQHVWDDAALQTEAKARQDGYIHLADRRAPPEVNRVPDPSNIIASLLVQQGKLVKGSYEPSRTYRIFNADGFLSLNESLQAKLVNACRQARKVEHEIFKDQK